MSSFKLFCIIILICSNLPQCSFSQEQDQSFLSLKTESSKSDYRQAFEEAQTLAIQIGTDRFLKQLLEPQVLKTKKKLIQKNIIKFWPKYISSITMTSHQLKKEIHQFDFKFQILTENLKTLLVEQNFLAEQSQFMTVLPLIEFIDETDKTNYQWWRHRKTSEKKPLVDASNSIYDSLAEDFFKVGLRLINPIRRNDYEILPNTLRIDSFKDEDLIYISNFLDAQLLLKGTVKITQPENSSTKLANIHIDVLNPKASKLVLSIDKKVTESSSWFERKNILDFLQEELKSSGNDLASQIFENWQRGTLSSHTYTIEINGQFNLEEQGRLKQKISSALPELKSLKERSLSQKGLVFEAETQLTSELLSEKILGIKGIKLKRDLKANDQMILVFQKEAP